MKISHVQKFLLLCVSLTQQTSWKMSVLLRLNFQFRTGQTKGTGLKRCPLKKRIDR